MSRVQKKKDIWDLAVESRERELNAPQETTKTDDNESEAVEWVLDEEAKTTAFVIGSPNAGKSSLVARFLDKSEASVKPTIALEYSFGRKSRTVGLGKDVVHLWELGGGLSSPSLVDVPITMQSFLSLVVVVIVDLSKPASVLSTLLPMLKLVKDRATICARDADKEKAKTSQAARSRMIKPYSEHADRGVICAKGLPPSLVPFVIVGTKYDEFQSQDAEAKKIMARTLRFIAHTNGASLIYTSNKEEGLIQRFRALMNWYVFKGSAQPKGIVTDHLRPLFVPVGMDTLADIGAPPVMKRGAKNPIDLWKASLESVYPPESDASSSGGDAKSKKKSAGLGRSEVESAEFLEPDVDTIRRQKDEELEQYRREQERQSAGLAPSLMLKK